MNAPRSTTRTVRVFTLSALAVAAPLLAAVETPPPVAAANAEPALARTTGSTELTWGACPAFLPAGCQLAVLHGDPAAPNADVFLKLPGGSSFGRHWHTSAERMVLVEGELRVTYDGQAEAVLVPGSYAYGPARRIHEGRCASTVPCVLFIAFEGPVDATVVADESVAAVPAAGPDDAEAVAGDGTE
jgi:quercetin dioxygenase-like cupin family protein